MKTKHCQHCGKIVPKSAEFCTYCGYKQYVIKDGSTNYNETSLLTHTDWIMIAINGFSALIQFLISFQTLMMPLSKSDGEFILYFILALAGIIISIISCHEKHLNHLSLIVPGLGIIGNIAGFAFAAITSSDVMTIVGSIIIAMSFFVMHRQLK